MSTFRNIPDEIVDAFVDKIVVHKDYFEWHLFFDDTTMMKVKIDGNKRNHDIFCETALDVNGSTGCNQAQGLIDPRKSCFLTSLTVTKEDVQRYFAKNPKYKKVNGFKEMRVDIYI